jgi:hypothetical protein
MPGEAKKMTITKVGTYAGRMYAEREALSMTADAPEGVEFVLRVEDSGEWTVEEHDSTDGRAWSL